MFQYFLILRVISIWLVQTWFVPDEYWQSLEVAHKLTFGYGFLTWEWKKGLRSYLHPILISIIYKILETLNLDFTYLLIILPRITQAVLSAYSDYCFYTWTGRKRWAAFCIASSWFWFYIASRTLINTFETSLTTIALSMFPWKNSKYELTGSAIFLWFVAIVCIVRPTAMIPWIPLCLYHIIKTETPRWKLIFGRYLPVGLTVILLLTALDSWCYGSLLIAPWEFLKFNVFQNISSHYGVLPWYWYFTAGLPTVLGIHVLPFIYASIKVVQEWKIRQTQLILLATIMFTVISYSFLEHKEFRFMAILLPMVLFISSDMLARWSGKANRLMLWLVAGTIFVGSLLPAIYLGYIHQRGTLDVMPILQNLAEERPKDTSFLFLMPCHSTPLYSHIHVNVPIRFLSCEPNFDNIENYKDEADHFYENPVDWLAKEYGTENSSLPSHIIHFDHLHSDSSVFKMFKQIHSIFHTEVPSGKVGYNVLVHQHVNY